MASLNRYSNERIKDILIPSHHIQRMILNEMVDRINVYNYVKIKSEWESFADYLEIVEDYTLKAENFMNGEYIVETDDGGYSKEKIKEEDELKIFNDIIKYYIPKKMINWLINEECDINRVYTVYKALRVLIDEFSKLEDTPKDIKISVVEI